MCEVFTLASAGLGIAQSVVGYQAASAQSKAQSAASRQNAINAARAAQDQYSNLSVREQQEGQSTYQQKLQSEIQKAQMAAAGEVAAGEGNVGGNSVGHVLRDIYAQAGRNDVTLDTNLQMKREALEKDKLAARTGAQSQINAVPKGQKPSWIPYAIGAGSGLLNTYSNMKIRKKV